MAPSNADTPVTDPATESPAGVPVDVADLPPFRSDLSSSIRVAAVWVVLAVSMSLFSLVALLFMPWRGIRIRLASHYGRWLGQTGLWLLGTPRLIHNEERIEAGAPAIFVINHSSTLDLFAIISLFTRCSVGIGKKELVWVPFFGIAYLLSGNLLLDRSNREAAVASLERLVPFVRDEGLSIWIAPEGTRSRDGQVAPFKSGFVHLAIATGLPVIPVILHDTHVRMPLGGIRLRPGPATISVLPPIDTATWTAENSQQHAAAVRQLFLTTLGQT